MCGIAAIISLDGERPLAGQIANMAVALRHRGPDDEGFLLCSDRGAGSYAGSDTAVSASSADGLPQIAGADHDTAFLALGHRRLSIFDTSFAGHQPMSYRGRYWIVFNGEVYNFIELKEELSRSGYAFSSDTDTEVIMAAYDCWGEACVQRFNGMWAFVLLDTETNIVFLSRDRFGIKPLYYYKDRSRIVISSEIKAILACDGIETSPDEGYCSFFLRTGGDDYTVETAFSNIFRIPPASRLSCRLEDLQGGSWPVQTYWTVTPTPVESRYSPEAAADYAEEYRTLLKDSVRLRLRADVPVGLALSGGLDSSTLAYMIGEVREESGAREPFETFSSCFKTEHLRAFDESGLIARMADRFGLTSNLIEPKDTEILDEHGKMIRALETPTPSLHMGGWHTYRLAQERRFKVVLDGQGADELLAGYYIFAANYFPTLGLADLIREYRRLSAIANFPSKYANAGVAGNVLRRLIGKSRAERAMMKLVARAGAKNPKLHAVPLNEALNMALQTDIVNLLHYGDKLAMSHGIESRHPFLDYRLVEFLAAVPAVYKIHNGWTKYLARIAMDGRLPDAIVWKKEKLGWPDPTAYWLDGVLVAAVAAMLNNTEYSDWARSFSDPGQATPTTGVQPRLRAFNLGSWHQAFFGSG